MTQQEQEGGTIGTGQAPIPGEQGFTGTPQDGQANTEQLKSVVSNNHQWEAFTNYIDALIEQQHKILEQSDNDIIMYRSQGAVASFEEDKTIKG